MADTAGRLARALLREAVAAGEAEAVESGLEVLARAVRSVPDLQRFVNHPLIPDADKERILLPLAENRLVRRVLRSLVAAREIGLLTELHRRYVVLRNRATGRVDVEVRVPRPLTVDEESRTQEAVSRVAGRAAALHVAVDPSLVGGMQLRIEGRVIDNSLKTRLAEMKERLLAV